MKVDSTALARLAVHYGKEGYAYAKVSNEMKAQHQAVKAEIIAFKEREPICTPLPLALKEEERKCRIAYRYTERGAKRTIGAYSRLTTPTLLAKILASRLPRELRDEIYAFLLPERKEFAHHDRLKLDFPYYCGYTSIGKAFMTELVQLLYRTSKVSFNNTSEMSEPILKGLPVLPKDFISKFDMPLRGMVDLQVLLSVANKNATIDLWLDCCGVDLNTFCGYVLTHLPSFNQLEKAGFRITVSCSLHEQIVPILGFKTGTNVSANLDVWKSRYNEMRTWILQLCYSRHGRY